MDQDFSSENGKEKTLMEMKRAVQFSISDFDVVDCVDGDEDADGDVDDVGDGVAADVDVESFLLLYTRFISNMRRTISKKTKLFRNLLI